MSVVQYLLRVCSLFVRTHVVRTPDLRLDLVPVVRSSQLFVVVSFLQEHFRGAKEIALVHVIVHGLPAPEFRRRTPLRTASTWPPPPPPPPPLPRQRTTTRLKPHSSSTHVISSPSFLRRVCSRTRRLRMATCSTQRTYTRAHSSSWRPRATAETLFLSFFPLLRVNFFLEANLSPKHPHESSDCNCSSVR